MRQLRPEVQTTYRSEGLTVRLPTNSFDRPRYFHDGKSNTAARLSNYATHKTPKVELVRLRVSKPAAFRVPRKPLTSLRPPNFIDARTQVR